MPSLRYGRSGAAEGWHFLTGSEPAITQLANEVGFHYAYDPVFKQYAHPSGFVMLTPEGKVARYFFGVTHSPKEIYAALQEASANRIGSPIQQLFFLCFHYNPIKGRYGAAIMLITRIFGAAMVLAIGWMIVSMVRREGSATSLVNAIATTPSPRPSPHPRGRGSAARPGAHDPVSPSPSEGERAGMTGADTPPDTSREEKERS